MPAPTARPRHPRLPRRRDCRGRAGARCRFVARWTADGVVTDGARRRPRDVDMVLALPGARPSAARCCCTTTRAAGSTRRARTSTWPPACTTAASASRIIDNDATRALRRGRGAARPPGASASIRSTWSRPSARTAPSPPSSGSTRTGASQRDMAAYIADGYNDGGVQLLEAGTGVGKSFAYLVPALRLGRAPTASAPSCAPTRSTCRSSSSARTCRFLGARSSDEEYVADLRAAQGLAELPLPLAHAPGGGVAADAARAGEAATS